MKKAVVTGKRQAAIVDAPDPTPKEDWVLVKVHAAPMCTEYKSFTAGETTRGLGHEAAGEVAAVAGRSHLKPGDRVVVMPQYPCGQCALCASGEYIHCENNFDFAAFTGSGEGWATMAQYLLKPAWLLPRIPDNISYERASLACCALGPSFGAFETAGVDAFDTVLITGLGPVGMGAVVNARFRGARVIAVESTQERAERALTMGAVAVVDPRDPEALKQIQDLSPDGVDCALDCSGTVAAQRLCIDAARRKGKVVYVGECGDELRLRVSPDLIRKGLSITGSWAYNLHDYPKVMQIIRESPIVDLMVSHVLPMDRIQEAMEISASGNAAKVILQPWGSHAD
ncbi:MAG TPA: zinc-binding dehydrogenase [Armatimonadota bacterium]|nr:zinc-binding dehydrogenase [Armatimonadota bacterium]